MQLSIKNICKIMNNIKILNNFSLTINSGEIAILLGRSGAGKSTILRILNNLIKADSGKIELNHIKIDEQKKNIGIIFQSFNLFSNLSVIENITIALIQVKKKTKKEALIIGCKLLEKYDLIDKKDYPIYALSGGQKQKIAIIRTLAMQFKVICFDEPISALDPYSTNEILTFITELQKNNYIVIMTTHNVNILHKLHCSIHLLHDGRIIDSINSNELLNNNNINNNTQLKKFINGTL